MRSSGKSAKRLAVLSVAASIFAGMGAFGVTGPAKLATVTSSGVVSFGSAVTVGNQPSSPAPKNRITANDTATWIDRYQNTGPTIGAASVVQTWDPARQTYVADSFEVPAGWTESYTVDGTTWIDSPPADPATVRGLKASADYTPEAGKPGVVSPLTPPLVSTVSTSISGGGDSYYPVFRKQNVYSVLHHGPLSLTCFSKLTGLSCGTLKPLRTLTTSDHADSWVNQTTGRAFTPAVESKYAAPNSVVMSCLDLDKKRDCGIVQVDTGATVLQGSYVSQPWNFGNEVFFLYRREKTAELMVACVNQISMKPCGGQPYAAGTGYTIDNGWNASRYFNAYWAPNGQNPYRADGRVSYTATPTGTDIRNLECFDSASHKACTGVTRVGWVSSQDPVPHLDLTGALDGFCSRPERINPLLCYDLSGSALPVSAALEAWMPKGEISWMATLGGYGTSVGSHSLLPLAASGNGTNICFDWATDGSCVGFPNTTAKSKRAYALRRDPDAPTCIWSMGDDGILDSFEASTGASGCNITSTLVSPSYCDGLPNHVKGWDALTLSGLAGAHSGFTLTLRDAKNVPVPGWSARSFGAATTTVDISSISFEGSRTTLTVELQFVGLKASAFTSGTPTVEVTWKGDPLQVCSGTTAVRVCPSLFAPVEPKALTHRTAASTLILATNDVASIDLAFDSLTDLTCAVPSVTVESRINGGRYPASPGLEILQSAPVNLTYLVRNTGSTLIGSATVKDDADPKNVLSAIYTSGDTNGNGLIDQNETWVYSAVGDATIGQHKTHPVVSGTGLDAAGKAIPGVGVTNNSDTGYYLIAAPGVTLFATLYEGHDGGASCGVSGQNTLYADKDAPVTYCYVVKNTGNVPVSSISVSDPGVGVTEKTLSLQTGSLAGLLPGQLVVLWVESTNTVELISPSTSSATPSTGPVVNATATTKRFVGHPMLPAT